MIKTIGEMTAHDWAAAALDYGLRTEHDGAENEVYGGFSGKPRGCSCGCTPEDWMDLFERYEDGLVGEKPWGSC